MKEPGRSRLWPTAGGAAASSKPALLALGVAVVVVYLRIFGAGFVRFDDDIHVYANPFLNPLSIENLGKLWRQPYEKLYIPLAYSILAGIALFARVPAQMMSSIASTVTVSPTAFHVASVGFHVTNTLLCFGLAHRLTRSRSAALLCSFVFALHPLQVESVGWISELRGLSSAFFALTALYAFVLSRQTREQAKAASRALLAASAAGVVLAMLCKPAAAVLPLVALVIDRAALGTSWRRSILTALIGAACVLPFALITRSVQDIQPQGQSLWWQRPFIAGDALAFYVFKTVVPIDLCIEYGRTPRVALSHAWGYAIGALPVGLLVLCFIYRQRRPIAWLGALLFVTFLLPVLGLLPFSFQAHSTVADRYAYLPMIGIGLIVADAVAAVRSSVAVRVAGAAIVVLAILSFQQSRYWVDNVSFLRRTIEINPDAAYAHNNLGSLLLTQGQAEEAIPHFSKAFELEPGNAKAQSNLGLALVQLKRLEEAEPHFRLAVQLDPRYFKAYENLGAVYLRINRLESAIASLQAALEIQPSEANALNDLGIAFMRSGRAAEGVDAFQRAVGIDPSNAQYRKNLGRALFEQGRTDEARLYLTP